MSERERVTDLLTQLPELKIDDVAVRRLRQRVLDDVSERGRGPAVQRTRYRNLALGGLVGAAIVVLGAGAVLRFGTIGKRAAPSEQTSNVVAQRSPAGGYAADVSTDDTVAAEWSRRSGEGVERIILSQGRFNIRVHEHRPDRRVVVELPDGRIDDLGTVFDVDVNRGRTRRVFVAEGRIVFHAEGRRPLTLQAGHVWEDDGKTDDDVATNGHMTSHRRPSRQGDPGHQGRPSNTGGAPAGANPAEHQAEDESYLNVIRLLRSERHVEAQAAARQYLRQYPDGFRREEMGAVIQGR